MSKLWALIHGRKWLRTAAYVAFALMALVVSLYLTFPADAVAQRLGHELSRASQGRATVSFGEVSLYRLSGIEADDVRVRIVRDRGEPVEIALDSAYARLHLLSLLTFNLAATVGFDVGEGSLRADLDPDADGVALSLRIDDIDLASPPLLSKLLDLPVRGVVAGSAEVEVALAASKAGGGGMMLAPEKTDGAASLTLREVSLGPATVQGFTIPAALSLGQLDMAFELKQGRLRMASFQQKGGQLRVQLTTSLTLRPELKASNLESCVLFKVSDEDYLRRFPTVATALELAQTQLAKDGEGFLHLRYGGTLERRHREPGLCRDGRRN